MLTNEAIMKTSGLTFVMLGSTDIDRSVDFYTAFVGLELLHRFEGFAFMNAGSTTIVLTSDLGGRITGGATFASELVFSVPSVRAAYEELRDTGATLVNEPRPVNPTAWSVTCADPDGHLISFYGAE